MNKKSENISPRPFARQSLTIKGSLAVSESVFRDNRLDDEGGGKGKKAQTGIFQKKARNWEF